MIGKPRYCTFRASSNFPVVQISRRQLKKEAVFVRGIRSLFAFSLFRAQTPPPPAFEKPAQGRGSCRTARKRYPSGPCTAPLSLIEAPKKSLFRFWSGRFGRDRGKRVKRGSGPAQGKGGGRTVTERGPASGGCGAASGEIHQGGGV